jgi:hypothetical protein
MFLGVASILKIFRESKERAKAITNLTTESFAKPEEKNTLEPIGDTSFHGFSTGLSRRAFLDRQIGIWVKNEEQKRSA